MVQITLYTLTLSDESGKTQLAVSAMLDLHASGNQIMS